MAIFNISNRTHGVGASSSTLRKVRKLGRNPKLFFRDLIAKRISAGDGVGHATSPNTGTLRQVALVQKSATVSDAILDAYAFLEQAGRKLNVLDTNEVTPLVLAYHPAAFGNPFQQLLYCSADSASSIVFPLRELDDLLDVRWPTRVMCHIHWLGGVLQGTSSRELARERLESFASQLDRLKANGVHLVWTVHNVLPHNSSLPEMECELRKLMVDRADAIHIMTERTTSETEMFFQLPEEKTFLCEHPSYEGVYPDFVERNGARYNLGISPNACVFLCFGSIQAYKGLRELLAAFDSVGTKANGEVHLIVAGIPSDQELAAELAAEFGCREDISLHLRRIPAEEVQYFFHAADFVVCSYTMTLNSGAAILAHSFGVPVIGPEIGAIADMIAAGGALPIPSMDRHDLVDSLVRATSVDPFSMREAIAAGRDRARPRQVSRRFFASLREKLA